MYFCTVARTRIYCGFIVGFTGFNLACFCILSGSANRGSFLIDTAEAVSENWRVGWDKSPFFGTREIIFYSNLCHAIDYRYKVTVGWLKRINFCFIRVIIISVFHLIKLLYFRCQAWQLKLTLIARNS